MSILGGAKTLLSGVFSGIWSKLGLWLGYLSIGIAIALGISAIWLYNQNSALNTKVGNLQTTVDSRGDTIKALADDNAKQDITIGQLQALRKTDAAVVDTLINDVKNINTRNSVTKAKLLDLEKKSEAVQHYFDLPIPAAVRNTSSVRDAVHKKPESSGDDGHKE